MRNSIQKSDVYCPMCQVGKYHLKLVTYTTWYNGEFITAPDFPAWVCDVCGRTGYDAEAIEHLNLLLSSTIDLKAEKKLRRKQKSVPAITKSSRTQKVQKE
jgi:YgiT-type zinc finger domain-containing protein